MPEMEPVGFEVELEPAAASENESIEPVAGTPSKKQVLDRQQDIAILRKVLPDLRMNTLTNKVEYGTRTDPIVLSGDDVECLTVQLAMEHSVFIPEQRMRSAVRWSAKNNRYCPIKRYLMECAYSGQEFSQWEKLGEYLTGNSDPIVTKALQKFLVGAVARAYRPGCSMSWVPIFIGKQGCGKSQLLRKLVPENLFAEMTSSLDQINKEAYRLHISWILELPEIDNYFKDRNIEIFKNLITTQIDETRMPYSSMPISLPRAFVMAGTSNRSEIFVDPTGNRRFMPIEIPMGFETPWRKLPDVRMQIWCSAMRAYERGMGWEITAEDLSYLEDYVQQFNVVDPWEQLIGSYLADKTEVTTTDVLINALDFAPQVLSQRDTRRCGSVMQQLGWRRQTTSRKDPMTGKSKSIRIWIRPVKYEKKESQLSDF